MQRSEDLLLQEERELAYWLRGVMQMCIYPPRPSKRTSSSHEKENGDAGHRVHGQPVAWSCSEEAVMKLIQEKDPFHKGLPSTIALRLLQAIDLCMNSSL